MVSPTSDVMELLDQRVETSPPTARWGFDRSLAGVSRRNSLLRSYPCEKRTKILLSVVTKIRPALPSHRMDTEFPGHRDEILQLAEVDFALKWTDSDDQAPAME